MAGSGRLPRHRRRTRLAGPLLVALLLPAVWSTEAVVAPDTAGAQSAANVTVKVTLERIHGLDGMDGGLVTPDPDFYAFLVIDGQAFTNEDTPEADKWENTYDVPAGWEFAKPGVDLSRGAVGVGIEIRDEDGGLKLEDDHVDIDPGNVDTSTQSGRNLELTVNLDPCSVSGEVVGDCSTTLYSKGGSDDAAEIWFRIDVEFPPSGPDLRLQCTHGPVWPQSLSTMTFTATTVDAAGARKRVDRIEIWVDDRAGPDLVQSNASQAVHTAVSTTAPVNYRCVAFLAGQSPVSSGWRVVTVGDPPPDEAVAVGYTGPTASRLDIVFVADLTSYGNPTFPKSPTFLTDVGQVIASAYFGFDIFLRNQDKFNFWIAPISGIADDANSGDCSHVAPFYPWADAVGILHTRATARDCAPSGLRIFSAVGPAAPINGSVNNNWNRVRHETGHRPFGLADEYCCDGGYYETDIAPNVYEEPEQCSADLGNVRPNSGCREFEDTHGIFVDSDWSVSDPGGLPRPQGDDLMEDRGPHTPQPADVRRIEWLFGECARAGC